MLLSRPGKYTIAVGPSHDPNVETLSLKIEGCEALLPCDLSDAIYARYTMAFARMVLGFMLIDATNQNEKENSH